MTRGVGLNNERSVAKYEDTQIVRDQYLKKMKLSNLAVVLLSLPLLGAKFLDQPANKFSTSLDQFSSSNLGINSKEKRGAGTEINGKLNRQHKLIQFAKSMVVSCVVTFIINIFIFEFVHPLFQITTAGHPMIQVVADEIAEFANISSVEVRILNSETATAYTGALVPQIPWVVVSSGLLSSRLTRDEINSIVAHEIGHVKHRDVLTSILIGAATFSALRVLGSPFKEVLAPAVALVELWKSRRAELRADAFGAHMMGSTVFIAALRKIDPNGCDEDLPLPHEGCVPIPLTCPRD